MCKHNRGSKVFLSIHLLLHLNSTFSTCNIPIILFVKDRVKVSMGMGAKQGNEDVEED